MNQSETGFWQLVKNNLNGFPTRIENVISSGFPDVVAITSKIILIELKVEKKGWVYFRSSQIAFFTRVRRAGEYVRIMTRADNLIVVTSSNDLLQIKGTPYKVGYMRYRMVDIIIRSSVWRKAWDWKTINEVLFTE